MKHRSKLISVRIEQKMYNKMLQDGAPLSETIRKAILQYYRAKEKNQKIYKPAEENKENVIQFMQNHIEDLQNDIEFLRDLHSTTIKKAFENATAPLMIEENNSGSRWRFWKR